MTPLPRPRTAVSFGTIAFSMLAVEVISGRWGPGDVPVRAGANVAGKGGGDPRKAFVSCFFCERT